MVAMKRGNRLIYTVFFILAPLYLSFLFLPRLRYFFLFLILLSFFTYKFINKIKKELIFSSFILFLVIFSFDGFMYLYRTKDPEKLYLPDGTAIYKPNQNIKTKYNEEIFKIKNPNILIYKIDENGYRNKTIPDSITYLVLGDSYAFGLHVTQDSIWTALLSKFTKKNVYNLGVSNTNPEQYLQTFKNFLKKYPDKKIQQALFMIYQGNDLIDMSIENWKLIYKSFQNPITYYKALIGEKKKKSTIYTLYIIYKMFKNKKLIEVNTYTKNKTIITKKELYDIEISEKEFLNHPNINNIKKSIIEFVNLCNRERINPTVIFAPSKALIYSKNIFGKERKSKFIEYFKLFCDSSEVPYIDLTSYIREEVQQRDLYYVFDNHWNANGNLFVAKILKNYLERR